MELQRQCKSHNVIRVEPQTDKGHTPLHKNLIIMQRKSLNSMYPIESFIQWTH